jgi:hypothetical protein
MKEKVEVGHEEVPSRHPLAAFPFAAILIFVGGRVRRSARARGSDCLPVRWVQAAELPMALVRRTTLRGNEGRLWMPPETARAAGPPRSRPGG